MCFKKTWYYCCKLNKKGFKFIGETFNIALKSIFTTFKKHDEKDKEINFKDVKYYPIEKLKNNSGNKIIYTDEIKK